MDIWEVFLLDIQKNSINYKCYTGQQRTVRSDVSYQQQTAREMISMVVNLHSAHHYHFTTTFSCLESENEFAFDHRYLHSSLFCVFGTVH